MGREFEVLMKEVGTKEQQQHLQGVGYYLYKQPLRMSTSMFEV
jgi:hypothetical protein